MKSQLGIAVVVLSVIASHAEVINGVDMDFVQVGNPNSVDSSLGYGAVGYDYSIGTHEVSINQFEAARVQDSRMSNNNENHWYGTLGGSAPAVNVSYHEAAMFCNFLTTSNAYSGAYEITGGMVTGINRSQAVTDYGMVYVMPTADEWYKAAYYTGSDTYSLYANGTDTAPVNNVDAIYDNGTGTVDPWLYTDGNVEANHQTYNMMGNIWEFTETIDGTGTNALFFGGAVTAGTEVMNANFVGNGPVNNEYTVVGFRVAAIPEPGTISLMGLSTLGLFFTRTMRRRKRTGRAVKRSVRKLAYCDAFVSHEEWVQAQSKPETPDNALNEFLSEVINSAVEFFQQSLEWVRKLDKKFWNWMVVRYDRKLDRRYTRKEKAIHIIDAILEKLMK